MPFAFIRVEDENGFEPETILCKKLNEKYPNAEIVHLFLDARYARAIVKYDDDSEMLDKKPIYENWQKRLISENNDLQFRINSLRDFLTSNRNRVINLATEDVDDLLEQLNLMIRLQKVLQRRINKFD